MWGWKLPEVSREVVDDKKKKSKVNDNGNFTKILSSNHLKSCECDLHRIQIQGKAKVNDKKMMNRMNQQKRLPMFGDKDKDGIKNIFDPRPFKKDKLKKLKQWI